MRLRVKLSDGEFTALLPVDDTAILEAHGLKSSGTIITHLKRNGKTVQKLGIEE